MNQTTARMLLRYSQSMFKPEDAWRHKAAIQQLYRWAKRWWTGLSARQRCEVRRRLLVGKQPLARHFVGAPPTGRGLNLTGITDSPAPRSRAPFKAAKFRRAAKRAARKRREVTS
jgi:hypothetical protein